MSKKKPLVIITDKASVDAEDVKLVHSLIQVPEGDYNIVSATLEGIEQVLPENNGGEYHEFILENCYDLIKGNLKFGSVKKKNIKIQHCKAGNGYTYLVAHA